MKMILRTAICLERSCWNLHAKSYYTEFGKVSICGQHMLESYCFSGSFNSTLTSYGISMSSGALTQSWSVAFNDLDSEAWNNART